MKNKIKNETPKNRLIAATMSAVFMLQSVSAFAAPAALTIDVHTPLATDFDSATGDIALQVLPGTTEAESADVNPDNVEEGFYTPTEENFEPNALPNADAIQVAAQPDQVVIDMPRDSAAEQAALQPVYDEDYGNDILFPEDRTGSGRIFSVDPRFVGSIFNMKEVVAPSNKARAACVWLGVIALAGGFYVLDQYCGLGSRVIDVVRFNSTALMAFIYGIEPAMAVYNMIFARYPKQGETIPPSNRAIPAPGGEEVAFVIPAHYSEKIIEKSIHAILKFLKPEQIFVVDNGASEQPLDNTRDVLHAISPDINYIWQGIGNKTLAQYAGVMAAEKKGYKFVMTTDDDVRIPENFDFCTDKFNDDIKAVCFAIRPVAPDGNPSILVDWQELEYQGSDCAKLTEDRFCGVQYPHGAGALWDLQTFKEVLRRHDTVFYAEDVKQGIQLTRMGKQMLMDASIVMETDAPTSIFGPMPNYYHQRVRSWEMGRHVYGLTFMDELLSLPNHERSAKGYFTKKLGSVSAVIGLVADWMRVPLTVSMVSDPQYWIKTAGFMLASSATPALLNFSSKLKHRPDLKAKTTAILTFPVYKAIYAVASVAGAFRALFIYNTNYHKKPKIAELEKANDPRCVWLQQTEAQE